MPFSNIIIIGGGVCGVASAIALSNAFASLNITPLPKITIYELRDEPTTIGGAVNLTPTALRCLDILGVWEEIKKRGVGSSTDIIQLYSLHNASSMGTIDYRGKDGTGFDGYRGMRVRRADLLNALIAVAEKQKNISVSFGKKLVGITETSAHATVKFGDGTEATGDFVLGCDGIHSATRMKFVQPERVPEYSGIASAYGYANVTEEIRAQMKPFIQDTSLAMARRGAILTTYFEPKREKLYVAALMESKKEVSKDGWRALGADKEAIKADIVDRFAESALPYMKNVVHGTDEWFLFPVYCLPPDGKWHTDRVMLLGDAAHAVSQNSNA
jgi:2-polyprenyl-6-methoxyphenol hydroxylase-like FAD-dependent oxidoreductase